MKPIIIFAIILVIYCCCGCLGGILYYFLGYSVDEAAKSKLAKELANKSTQGGTNAFNSLNAQITYHAATSYKPLDRLGMGTVVTVDPSQKYWLGAINIVANGVVFFIAERILMRLKLKLERPDLAGKAFETAYKALRAKTSLYRFLKDLAKKGYRYVASFVKFSGQIGTALFKLAQLEMKAAMVAAKAAVAGGKMAAMAGMDAALGPIGVALFVFQALTLAIDLSPANHYNLLGSWQDIKEELEKGLKEANIDLSNYPPRVGPMDGMYLTPMPESNYCMDPDLASKQANLTHSDVTPSSGCYPYQNSAQALKNHSLKAGSNKAANIPNEADIFPDPNMFSYTLLNEINNAMKNDVQYAKIQNDIIDAMVKKTINENQLNTLIDNLVDANIGGWMDIASNNMCTNNKGALTVDGVCMYTKAGCVAPPGPYEVDRAWSNSQNKCLAVLGATKDICDKNKLPYNVDKGTCALTKSKCMSQTGTPTPSNIGLEDYVDECVIPIGDRVGIEICSAIFGEVICKSLYQILNPDQYNSCQPGEIDVGLLCVGRCQNKYTTPTEAFAGVVDTFIALSPDVKTELGRSIFPCMAPTTNSGIPTACDEGYTNNGLGTCYKNCPAQYNFEGIDSNSGVKIYSSCIKDCGAYNKTNVGGVCYGTCPVGWSEMGLTTETKSCKNPALVFPNPGRALDISTSPCSGLEQPIGTLHGNPPRCSGYRFPTHKDLAGNYTTIYTPPNNWSGWSCPNGINYKDVKVSDVTETLSTGTHWCVDKDIFGHCVGGVVTCTREKVYDACWDGYKWDGLSVCNWDKGTIIYKDTTYSCNGDEVEFEGGCYTKAKDNSDSGAKYDDSICGANHYMTKDLLGTCRPYNGITQDLPKTIPDRKRNDANTKPARCKEGTTKKGLLCQYPNCEAIHPNLKKISGTDICTTSGTTKTLLDKPDTMPKTRKIPFADD